MIFNLFWRALLVLFFSVAITISFTIDSESQPNSWKHSNNSRASTPFRWTVIKFVVSVGLTVCRRRLCSIPFLLPLNSTRVCVSACLMWAPLLYALTLCKHNLRIWEFKRFDGAADLLRIFIRFVSLFHSMIIFTSKNFANKMWFLCNFHVVANLPEFVSCTISH